MKNKLISFLSQRLLFLLFILFFSFPAVFGQTSAFTDQKSKIQTLSNTKVLSDSKKNDDQQNNTKAETQAMAENHTQKNDVQTEQIPKHPANKAQNTIAGINNMSSHSFRTLLIQGKKRLIHKTKDMKVESGNIVESKLFFVDIDFQKRIFEDEAIK